MKLYPRLYCEKITTITPEYLKENNIKGLILDVDNTLLDFDLKIVEGLKEWHDEIRENGIKCIILSNSNKLTKVKMVADLLEIPFLKFAMKPLKRGFIKGLKVFERLLKKPEYTKSPEHTKKGKRDGIITS